MTDKNIDYRNHSKEKKYVTNYIIYFILSPNCRFCFHIKNTNIKLTEHDNGQNWQKNMINRILPNLQILKKTHFYWCLKQCCGAGTFSVCSGFWLLKFLRLRLSVRHKALYFFAISLKSFCKSCTKSIKLKLEESAPAPGKKSPAPEHGFIVLSL